MMNVLSRMWNDDAGYIISTEMLLIFVILVLGLIAGWANLRSAIVAEFTESANAILSLNQSFSIDGQYGCSGNSGPSGAADNPTTTSVLASGTANPIDFILCP